MEKEKRKDPSAIFWDLVVESSKDLIPGINGFIGRAPDCLFNIWENFDPQRHDDDDYRAVLGKGVSQYHDFLRIEQNGSIRITHRTHMITYVIKQKKRDEFPYPSSTNYVDYYRYAKSLKGPFNSLQQNDELYLFPGDLLVLSGGYGLEIRVIPKQPQKTNPRLRETQLIEL